MIFEALYESAQRGELILVDGGICHYHLRRDGQLTIREIISIKPGAGKVMLNTLKQVAGARTIFAKCPIDLDSGNKWYKKNGFELIDNEITKSGRKLNLWEMKLS